MIRFTQDNQTYERVLLERKWVQDLYLDDYGWMNLEELYEDIVLGLEEKK